MNFVTWSYSWCRRKLPFFFRNPYCHNGKFWTHIKANCLQGYHMLWRKVVLQVISFYELKLRQNVLKVTCSLHGKFSLAFIIGFNILSWPSHRCGRWLQLEDWLCCWTILVYVAIAVASLLSHCCLVHWAMFWSICNRMSMTFEDKKFKGCFEGDRSSYYRLTMHDKNQSINQLNFYSATIPGGARLSGATAESVFNSKIDKAVL